jgi:hypothetical protein
MIARAGFEVEFRNQERTDLELLDLFGRERCNKRESQTNTVPFGPTRVILNGGGFLESRGHLLDSGQKRTAPFFAVVSSTQNRNECTPVVLIQSKL